MNTSKGVKFLHSKQLMDVRRNYGIRRHYHLTFMIRQLLLFLTSLSLSCNNSKNLSLKEVLTSECFWDRTNESDVIGGLNSCYRFLPDGQCFFYYYNFYNHKVTDSAYRFEDNDVIVPTTWTAKGDTLLIARGTHYKVLSFAKDCVIVEGYSKDTMIFRKNCQTILGK